MINFNDIKITDKEQRFFLPAPLAAEVSDYMKKANIKETSNMNWRDVHKQFPKEVEKTKAKYENAGYTATTCITVIISKANPEELFRKTLLFFGDTIDPDYQKEQKYWKQRSEKTYERDYKDWLNDKIPVRKS